MKNVFVYLVMSTSKYMKHTWKHTQIEMKFFYLEEIIIFRKKHVFDVNLLFELLSFIYGT